MRKSATTDTFDTLNKSMSQMQFSRPDTPTNNRQIRPLSAGSTRMNNRKAGLSSSSNRYSERENTSNNTQTLKIDPSTVTLNPSSVTQTPLSKVPRFVETDKQVLRFFCHFFDKDTQVTHRPNLLKVRHPSTARLFNLMIYLNDFTVEITEEKQVNSGHHGGQFYKRNYLKKDDGTDICVQDLKIGGTLTLLGHDFFITDCDSFTRGYFRRVYDIMLGDPEPRPILKDPAIGAQNSTGLGMTGNLTASAQTLNKTSRGTRSQDYVDKRGQIDKTTKFLNYSGVTLNFRCVEIIDDPSCKTINDAMLGAGKQYCLTYSMCDDQIEVRTIRSTRAAADDPSLLLKKGRLPINWRDQNDVRKKLRYYEPEDLITGNVIDCFGRKLLLLNCDKRTRQYYQKHYGITQHEVFVEDPVEITYENSIPQLGDGYLAIGGEADTLATCYGHSKPAKDWQKANRNMGQIIRCKMKMLTENRVNAERVFMLTFHLEDDSLSVYEEKTKNSGCNGGQFLKRGVYVNGLPPDCSEPRHFVPTDIYLGNIILLNGYEMQITEMDDLSVKFCEENSDEFPFFDTYEIIHKLMDQVLDLGLDLRQFIVEHYDPHNQGYLNRDDFVKCLEDLSLSQEMNDQELMTLMRRFKGVLEGNLQSRRNNQSEAKYHFHEMCDLFSHATYVRQVGRKRQSPQKSHLERLLEDFRGRVTQWRRLFRMDHHTDDTHITVSTFINLCKKAGMKLTTPNVHAIIENFALETNEAAKVLQKLPKPTEMDDFDVANAKISESTSALSRSKGRGPDWIRQRRELHGQTILRKGLVEKKKSEGEYNFDEVVLNYCDFCDAVYVCDWVE